jgi:hypothetical protein
VLVSTMLRCWSRYTVGIICELDLEVCMAKTVTAGATYVMGGALGNCKVDCTHFGGLTDLWMSILCSITKDGWYKLDCLMEKYDDCSQDMLMTCLMELSHNSNKMVQWNCYQKVVVGKTKGGRDYKVLRLQYKLTPARQYLQYMRPQLTRFITHNFIAQWQAEQYRVCLAIFSLASILSVVDFAEDYSFAEWNKIQGMHFSSVQVTILVHVSYRWNEQYLLNPHCGALKLLTEYHYYI